MKKIPIKRLSYVNGWVTLLGIIGLIIVSTLPIISVDESGYVSDNLHYTYSAMQKSNNSVIVNLSNDVGLIIIAFWILIISSLLFYLGLIIHMSQKSDFLSRTILVIGSYGSTLFSIVIIGLFVLFIKNISLISSISLSSLLSSFNYQYITLIISIIFLICSIVLSYFITPFSINYFREFFYKRSKNSFKKRKTISKDKNNFFDEDISYKPSKEEEFVDSRSDVENWLKQGFSEPKETPNMSFDNEPSDVIDDEIDELLKGIDDKHPSDIVQVNDEDIDKTDSDPFIPFGSSESSENDEAKDAEDFKDEIIKNKDEKIFDDVEKNNEIKDVKDLKNDVEKQKSKPVIKDIKKEDVEGKNSLENTPSIEPKPVHDKNNVSPFSSQIKKEEPVVEKNNVDKTESSVSFNDVLDSVIKKNHPSGRKNKSVNPETEIADSSVNHSDERIKSANDSIPTETKTENASGDKKEQGDVTLVCPGCEAVFKVSSNQKIVKCPKCGLEGEM